MKWRPRTRIGGALALAGLFVIVVLLMAAVASLVRSGTLLVWGGRWGGLETATGPVDKKTAEAFLATVDTDWRARVGGEGEVGHGGGTAPSLPPEARCYFVTSGDGKQSLGTIACGPVRRLGTAEGAVWDTARIESPSSENQTGQAWLRTVEGAAWQRSVPEPADGKLLRPDGKEPPDGADKLVAPPAPQAAPGLIQVEPELDAKIQPISTVGPAKPGDTKSDEPGGHNISLIAPDITVTLTNLGTVDIIGTGDQIQAPATGERFVVAQFTATKTRDPVIGSASEPVRDVISGEGSQSVRTKFAVTIDGNRRSRPIELVNSHRPSESPGPPPGASGDVVGKGYLVASVPDHAIAEDVVLTATTQGVTQRLSLLSGTRTSIGIADAYYRNNRYVTLDQRLPNKTIQIGRDFDSTYTVGLTTAGLTAWDPDQGWAPPGRAWLRFGYTETWDQPSALYEITWNPDFFTATADGRPIRLPSDYNTYTRILVAAVPADVKAVRITVAARFTFLEKPGIDYAKPTSGTADFGTLTTNATFE